MDIADHIDSCLSYVCTKTPIRVVKKKDYVITNIGNRIYIDMSEMGDSLRNVTILSSDSKISSEFEIRDDKRKSELKGLTPDSRYFRLKLSKRKYKNGNKIVLEIAVDDELAHSDLYFGADTKNNLKVILRFENPTAQNSSQTALGADSLSESHALAYDDFIKIVNIDGSTGPNSISLNNRTQQHSVFLNNPDFEVSKEFKGWIRLMNKFLEPETIFVKFREDTLAISGNAGNEMFHKLYGPVNSPGCFQNFSESIKHGILSTRFTKYMNDNQIRKRIPEGAIYPKDNPESFYLDKRMVDTLALAMFLSGSLKVDLKNRHLEIEASRECFLDMIFEIPERNDKSNLAIYTESSYEEIVNDMKEILKVEDDDVRNRKNLTILIPKREKKRICIVVWRIESGRKVDCIDSMVDFANNMKSNKGLLSKQWAHVAMDDVELMFKEHLKAIENVHVVKTSNQAEAVRLYGFPHSDEDRTSTLEYVKDVYDTRNILLEKTRQEDAIYRLIEEEIEKSKKKESEGPTMAMKQEALGKYSSCDYQTYRCDTEFEHRAYTDDDLDREMILLKKRESFWKSLGKRLNRDRFETTTDVVELPAVDVQSIPAEDSIASDDDFVLSPEAEMILQSLETE